MTSADTNGELTKDEALQLANDAIIATPVSRVDPVADLHIDIGAAVREVTTLNAMAEDLAVQSIRDETMASSLMARGIAAVRSAPTNIDTKRHDQLLQRHPREGALVGYLQAQVTLLKTHLKDLFELDL